MELHTDTMPVKIPPAHIEQISSSERAVLKVADETNSISSSSTNSQTDQITISEEASEKSINDKNQTAMRKIMGKEDAEETEGKNELDEMIAELQEKITKLMVEIAEERRNSGEQSEQKVKSMEAELAALNTQLIELLEQKMESTKKWRLMELSTYPIKVKRCGFQITMSIFVLLN